MKGIDAVIQYLDWAMIAAQAEAHPECSKVTLVIDIERRQCTTSFTMKGKGDENQEGKTQPTH